MALTSQTSPTLCPPRSYRTGKMAAPVEAALQRAGIPFQTLRTDSLGSRCGDSACCGHARTQPILSPPAFLPACLHPEPSPQLSPSQHPHAMAPYLTATLTTPCALPMCHSSTPGLAQALPC